MNSIAIELGACSIAWHGGRVLHATHMTQAGKSSPNRLLSLWNGVGGNVLRALLDRLQFTTNAHKLRIWKTIPDGTRVIVQQRCDGKEEDDGTWSQSPDWRHHYGTLRNVARPGAPIVARKTMGAKGDSCESTRSYVTVRLDRDLDKGKKPSYWTCQDVRVHWRKLDESAIATLELAMRGVDEFRVRDLIAASKARETTYLANARSGATTHRGKGRVRRRGGGGGGSGGGGGGGSTERPAKRT